MCSLVVRPHAQHLYDALRVEHLVDESVLKVDSSRAGAGEGLAVWYGEDNVEKITLRRRRRAVAEMGGPPFLLGEGVGNPMPIRREQNVATWS